MAEGNPVFPVPIMDVEREVRFVINRDGIEKLRSKIVREHLKEKFNADFSEFKAEIDDIIKTQIMEMDKEEAPSSSDTDSDPGVPDDIGPPVAKAIKRKATPKASKKEEKDFKDEDLHSAVKKRRRAATKTTERKPPREKKTPSENKRKSLYSKLCYISDELMQVVGRRFAPRMDVVKAMWAYIKQNELQDPKNKQFVLSDDVLLAIFKQKRFKPFGMMKGLVNHCIDQKNMDPEYQEMAKEEEKRLAALPKDNSEDIKKEVDVAAAAANGHESSGGDEEDEEGADESDNE